MIASEPWSGHFAVTPTLWATAHTTQFTQPGWRYLAKGRGSGILSGGGTFVSLVSAAKELTLVVETAGVGLDTWGKATCDGLTQRGGEINGGETPSKN